MAKRRSQRAREVYRFKQPVEETSLMVEVAIFEFLPTSENPEGVAYRLQLYERESGGTVLRYDFEPGKGHHRHLRGSEVPYEWHGIDQLLADFRRDVELVKAGKL